METAPDVVQQYANVVNEITFVTRAAIGGIRYFAKQIEGAPIVPSNPDPVVFVGAGDPNLPTSKRFAQLTKSQVLERTAVGGLTDQLIGQQWILLVFSAWEYEFRSRLATAHGCTASELKYSLFGDLKNLRHDVIHNRGIASQENTGKCELLGSIFPIRNPILLTDENLLAVFAEFPFERMVAGPTT
jgi:hypothetical protein